MNKRFMQEAIRIAVDSVRRGNGGPFGAVVVRAGAIVGRGANRVTTSHDPTAHAEIVAIRKACRRLNAFHLSDCDLYSSCEPCPMCLAAIYWARIKRVFYASTRRDAREAGFDDAFIQRQLALPVARRKLAMQRHSRREALKAFGEWKKKANRIPY